MLIDKLLKILERKADEVDYDLDNNADYLRVCAIVTAMDFHEPITFDDKEYVWNALRQVLYPAVGLDYDMIYQASVEVSA